MLIVLDPGHSSIRPGAIGPGGTHEEDITLAVARQAAALLSSIAQVVLTRGDGSPLAKTENEDLTARAKKANDLNASCFVSIHCNSATDKEAHGTETYSLYPRSERGRELAQKIQLRLADTLKLADRGCKEANFAVLRETRCPAALVEIAFISNPAEEKLLRDFYFQSKAAFAIASGIADFLGVRLRDPESVLTVAASTPFEKLVKAAKFNSPHQPAEPVTLDMLAIVLERLGVI